jgi:tetratricopeptide (TPR) repeat protein
MPTFIIFILLCLTFLTTEPASAKSDSAATSDPDYLEAMTLRDKYSEDMDESKIDRAIAKYTQALSRHQDSAAIFYARGTAWGFKGDAARADSDYYKAASLEPDNLTYKFEVDGIRLYQASSLMMQAAEKKNHNDALGAINAYYAALELVKCNSDTAAEHAYKRSYLQSLFDSYLSCREPEPSIPGDFPAQTAPVASGK